MFSYFGDGGVDSFVGVGDAELFLDKVLANGGQFFGVIVGNLARVRMGERDSVGLFHVGHHGGICVGDVCADGS